jgi:hypothetical protein
VPLHCRVKLPGKSRHTVNNIMIFRMPKFSRCIQSNTRQILMKTHYIGVLF